MTIIIGGNQGQFGDLLMMTVVARAIKEKFPSSKYILGINKKYWDIEPLFRFHPYIDKIIQWDGYDNFPTQNDINLFNEIKPDIFLNPMSKHPNEHCWFNLVKHQTEAMCIQNGFSPPSDLSCYLNKYFLPNFKYSNYVCIAPFTAWEKKNISNQKWQKIIDFIYSKGMKVLQIGATNEFKFKNTEKEDFNYFESVKAMLSCRMLITLDGGMNWVASAYQQKVLALMGFHYEGLETSKLYQPINKNAIYLESNRAENINDNLILKTIEIML